MPSEALIGSLSAPEFKFDLGHDANQKLSSRDRNILALYNKTHELASLLADLVRMQLLTDTTILHISTLGVAPFFVENIPELQLAALKLVTNLFSKYENHRKLLLDDILGSVQQSRLSYQFVWQFAPTVEHS